PGAAARVELSRVGAEPYRGGLPRPSGRQWRGGSARVRSQRPLRPGGDHVRSRGAPFSRDPPLRHDARHDPGVPDVLLAVPVKTERAVRITVESAAVVTPIGQDLEAFWSALVTGASGISQIERFPVADLRVGR